MTAHGNRPSPSRPDGSRAASAAHRGLGTRLLTITSITTGKRQQHAHRAIISLATAWNFHSCVELDAVSDSGTVC